MKKTIIILLLCFASALIAEDRDKRRLGNASLVDFSGTIPANTIPKMTDGNTIGSSSITDDGTLITFGVKSLQIDSMLIGRASATDQKVPYIRFKGDADSDASATVSETLGLTLVPAATSTNAYWLWLLTQSSIFGIGADNPILSLYPNAGAAGRISSIVLRGTETTGGDNVTYQSGKINSGFTGTGLASSYINFWTLNPEGTIAEAMRLTAGVRRYTSSYFAALGDASNEEFTMSDTTKNLTTSGTLAIDGILQSVFPSVSAGSCHDFEAMVVGKVISGTDAGLFVSYKLVGTIDRTGASTTLQGYTQTVKYENAAIAECNAVATADDATDRLVITVTHATGNVDNLMRWNARVVWVNVGG